MDFALGLLTFGTLGFVAAFAYIGMRAAEKRGSGDQPKSSLSRDGVAERLSAKRAAQT